MNGSRQECKVRLGAHIWVNRQDSGQLKKLPQQLLSTMALAGLPSLTPLEWRTKR